MEVASGAIRPTPKETPVATRPRAKPRCSLNQFEITTEPAIKPAPAMPAPIRKLANTRVENAVGMTGDDKAERGNRAPPQMIHRASNISSSQPENGSKTAAVAIFTVVSIAILVRLPPKYLSKGAKKTEPMTEPVPWMNVAHSHITRTISQGRCCSVMGQSVSLRSSSEEWASCNCTSSQAFQDSFAGQTSAG